MQKLDLTKAYKSYFTAKTQPQIVDIEEAQFISISGKGDPSGTEFSRKIEAIYSVSYSLKFAMKALGKDFVVSKLEGLWSYDETKFQGKTIETASTDIPRSEWEYRLLIRLPDFVQEADVVKAKEAIIAKKALQLANDVEFFTMKEGRCVQMLHVGPFDKEPETLLVMGKFMDERKMEKNGLHHEIYLSDHRKTAPDKLRTILREPVK